MILIIGRRILKLEIQFLVRHKNATYLKDMVLATKEEVAKEDAKKRDRPGEVTDKDIKVNIDKEKRTRDKLIKSWHLFRN